MTGQEINQFIKDNPTLYDRELVAGLLAKGVVISVDAVNGRRRRLGLPKREHIYSGTPMVGAQTKSIVVDGITLSEREILLIKQSLGAIPEAQKVDHTRFFGESIKFGYYSDPHVGEKHFHENLWREMIAFFEQDGITDVYCPGDNLEGMSGRPGHIYELAQIGASAQLTYAASLFNLAPKLRFHIIDGNHDQWFKEKNNAGLVAGQELASRCPNVEFLGEWEARIMLHPNIELMLFHSNDGTAYADSYKLQKLIESLEGGKKPSIILSGHYHKQIAIFRRNVFGFECGTLCSQTRFMRGKKLQAHVGFGVIEVWPGEHGIERLRHEFFPYYD